MKPTLERDEQLALIDTGLNLCRLLESLIAAVKVHAFKSEQELRNALNEAGRDIEPTRAGLTWYREKLAESGQEGRPQ